MWNAAAAREVELESGIGIPPHLGANRAAALAASPSSGEAIDKPETANTEAASQTRRPPDGGLDARADGPSHPGRPEPPAPPATGTRARLRPASTTSQRQTPLASSHVTKSKATTKATSAIVSRMRHQAGLR